MRLSVAGAQPGSSEKTCQLIIETMFFFLDEKVYAGSKNKDFLVMKIARFSILPTDQSLGLPMHSLRQGMPIVGRVDRRQLSAGSDPTVHLPLGAYSHVRPIPAGAS